MRHARREGSWGRRLLLLLGGLVIVLVAVRWLMDWTASATVARTVEAFEQSWGPLDPASLGPPAVPSAQNRARCYRAAGSLLDFDGKRDNEALRGRGNALGVARAVGRDPGAVRALLDRNRLSLELIAEGLARPASDWEIHYERGVEAQLPNLLELMHLSRVVAASAMLKSLDGDTASALATLEQGFALSSSLRSEPLLMTHMVGLTAERELMEVFRAVASAQGLTSDDLRRLAAMVAALPGEQTLRDALKAEATVMNMALADITAGARSEVMDPEPLVARGAMTWAIRPMVRRAHNLYLEEMDRVIDRQGSPRYSRAPESERDLPWYGEVFSAVPHTGNLLLRSDLAEARRSLAATAVALLRHRLDRGAFPLELPALVPDYLDALPADPFTGKTFEYSTAQGAFLLRSAGDDPGLDPGNLSDTVLRWELATPEESVAGGAAGQTGSAAGKPGGGTDPSKGGAGRAGGAAPQAAVPS